MPFTSVVSAAVIGGDLIIGLSDGSIINCGRVQGPQGLKGDPGPIGATGRPGIDGNTIHTVQGAPDTSLGKDGDFAINVVLWEIYGPRAGGVWGTGTPLRGNTRGGKQEKVELFGNNPQGEGGGGGSIGIPQTTSTLPLSGTGGKAQVNAPGGNIVEGKPKLTNQAGLNNWIQAGLMALDEKLPVSLPTTGLPVSGNFDGDLAYYEEVLYLWTGDAWEEVGGGEGGSRVFIGENPPPAAEEGDQWFCSAADSLQMYIYYQGQWIPSSPPATLEGVVNNALLEQDQLQSDVDQAELDIDALEIKVADLEVTKGSVAKYKVMATSGGVASLKGEMYTDSEYITGITYISLAPFDLNDEHTKPVSIGDLVEFEMDSGIARFTVTAGDSANAMTVENNSGSGLIAVSQFIDIYIYPQNKAGASKEYVDQQDNLLKEYSDAEDAKLKTEIDKKADKEWVQGELDKKADLEYVDGELEDKADLEYVDNELDKKADLEYVNDELAKKADKEYVDTELAKKADKDWVEQTFETKADSQAADADLQEQIDALKNAPSVTVSDLPPTDAVNGAQWFDSATTLRMWVYYDPDDDGSGAWVPTTPETDGSVPMSVSGLIAEVEKATDFESLKMGLLTALRQLGGQN